MLKCCSVGVQQGCSAAELVYLVMKCCSVEVQHSCSAAELVYFSVGVLYSVEKCNTVAVLMLGCCIFGVLQCWSAGILECCSVRVLKCWNAAMLECCSV